MIDDLISFETLGLETSIELGTNPLLTQSKKTSLLSHQIELDLVDNISMMIEERVLSSEDNSYEQLIGDTTTEPIIKQPDLIVYTLSTPPTGIIGSSFNFSYRLRNRGNILATSSLTNFYLSKNNSLDAEDILIGTDEFVPLNPGENKRQNCSFNLDMALSLGEYYLIAQADSSDSVLESQETNNILIKSIIITQADLAIESISLLQTPEVGQNLSFNYSIKNRGTATTSLSHTDFFLSKDTILDQEDFWLGMNTVSSVKPGTYKNYQVSLNLDNEIQVGNYYLLAKADSTNNLLESNEDNNLFYQSLQIGGETLPDLILTTTSAPDTAVTSTTLTLNYTLSNQGQANVQTPFVTHFYLSDDLTLNESDLPLDSVSEAALTAGTSRAGTKSITLNEQLSAGTYYLIYQVDGLNQVQESQETNNSFAELITITNPIIDNEIAVYNSITGYGTVNAAAAVAKVLGQDTFPEVANLGGNYWGADLIKVPEVWAKNYTGQGIVVAVLDTGIDREHSDLSSNIWTNNDEIVSNGIDDDQNGYIDDVYGWSFASNNNNTFDVKGHGTHVAGTIAGVKNNFGVTGIAYDAKIMPVKVLNDQGSGTYYGLIMGIYYAVDNGADIINMSLAGSVAVEDLQDAIAYAASKGVIVVSAAGNSSGTTPRYPAYYAISDGLAVGAVDSSNKRAGFSNHAGNNSEMAYVNAPGVNVYSTRPKNSYGYSSGTSMATPHVAGVVALMLSANGDLSDTQVREILTQTAIPVS